MFNKSTIRNLLCLTKGNAFGLLLTLFTYPIITRIYSEKELGILSLITSFSTIFAILCTGSLEFALGSINEKKEITIIKHLLKYVFAFGTIISCFLGLILIHYQLFGYGNLGTKYLPILILSTIIQAAFTLLRYYNLGINNFNAISKIPILQHGTKCFFSIVLGFANFSVVGLVIAEQFSKAICIKKVLMPKSLNFLKSDTKKSINKFHLKKFANYPKYIMPSSLLNVAAMSLQVPIIVSCFGISVGGSFSIARAAFSMPLKIFGGSIADVVHRHFAVDVKNSVTHLRKHFLQTTLILASISFPLSIISYLYISDIFIWIFGEKWKVSGDIAKVLTPWAMGQFVVGTMSRTLLVLKLRFIKLIYDFVSLSFTLLILYIGTNNSIDAVNTIGIYSSLLNFSYCLYFLLIYYAIIYEQKTREQKVITA